MSVDIDTVCDNLNSLLLDGNFEAADQWFADLLDDEARLALYVDKDISLGLTVLMVSNGGEDKLPHRQKLYLYIQNRLLETMSEAKVLAHLGGLWGMGTGFQIITEEDVSGGHNVSGL